MSRLPPRQSDSRDQADHPEQKIERPESHLPDPFRLEKIAEKPSSPAAIPRSVWTVTTSRAVRPAARRAKTTRTIRSPAARLILSHTQHHAHPLVPSVLPQVMVRGTRGPPRAWMSLTVRARTFGFRRQPGTEPTGRQGTGRTSHGAHARSPASSRRSAPSASRHAPPRR